MAPRSLQGAMEKAVLAGGAGSLGVEGLGLGVRAETAAHRGRWPAPTQAWTREGTVPWFWSLPGCCGLMASHPLLARAAGADTWGLSLLLTVEASSLPREVHKASTTGGAVSRASTRWQRAVGTERLRWCGRGRASDTVVPLWLAEGAVVGNNLLTMFSCPGQHCTETPVAGVSRMNGLLHLPDLLFCCPLGLGQATGSEAKGMYQVNARAALNPGHEADSKLLQ